MFCTAPAGNPPSTLTALTLAKEYHLPLSLFARVPLRGAHVPQDLTEANLLNEHLVFVSWPSRQAVYLIDLPRRRTTRLSLEGKPSADRYLSAHLLASGQGLRLVWTSDRSGMLAVSPFPRQAKTYTRLPADPLPGRHFLAALPGPNKTWLLSAALRGLDAGLYLEPLSGDGPRYRLLVPWAELLPHPVFLREVDPEGFPLQGMVAGRLAPRILTAPPHALAVRTATRTERALHLALRLYPRPQVALMRTPGYMRAVNRTFDFYLLSRHMPSPWSVYLLIAGPLDEKREGVLLFPEHLRRALWVKPPEEWADLRRRPGSYIAEVLVAVRPTRVDLYWIQAPHAVTSPEPGWVLYHDRVTEIGVQRIRYHMDVPLYHNPEMYRTIVRTAALTREGLPAVWAAFGCPEDGEPGLYLLSEQALTEAMAHASASEPQKAEVVGLNLLWHPLCLHRIEGA